MINRFLYRTFYWTYDRGTWQWDLACLIFLVVIFAIPPDFLEGFTRRPLDPAEIEQMLRGFFAHLRG